jgi:hypothetical protein
MIRKALMLRLAFTKIKIDSRETGMSHKTPHHATAPQMRAAKMGAASLRKLVLS